MVMNDMTDDGKWGAPIPIVDGKRPGWLDDNEVITGVYPADFLIKPGTVDPAKSWAWNRVISIRLPASHPYYQQTQAIDWSAPIEAVHEDGRVQHVKICDETATRRRVRPSLEGAWWFDATDGKHEVPGFQWRIRNVQPATQTQTLTAQEHLARMEALVRKMAMADKAEVAIMGTGQREAYLEARALVAEMEPVVNGDLVEARRIVKETNVMASYDYEGGGFDSTPIIQAALAAIKRGRELARGDVA